LAYVSVWLVPPYSQFYESSCRKVTWSSVFSDIGQFLVYSFDADKKIIK
jgi:hypothetical protein